MSYVFPAAGGAVAEGEDEGTPAWMGVFSSQGGSQILNSLPTLCPHFAHTSPLYDTAAARMPVLLAEVRKRLSAARSRQQEALRLLGLNVKANAGKGIPVSVARGNNSDERSESQQQQALADFRILGLSVRDYLCEDRDGDEEEGDAGRLLEAWRMEDELREAAGVSSASEHHAGGSQPMQPTLTDPGSGSGARPAQPTSTDPNGYHKAHLDAQLSLGHAAHAVFLFFSRYGQFTPPPTLYGFPGRCSVPILLQVWTMHIPLPHF